MTIIHETKWKKEDGTEVDVVPLKDITVTAPGYSLGFYVGAECWAEMSAEANQSSQLYEALKKVYPKEADYCETLYEHTGRDEGMRKVRTYIEKAKVPELKEKIRQEMVFGKPTETFFKGKILNGVWSNKPPYEALPLSEETLKILNTAGWFVRDRKYPSSSYMQEATFYMPDLDYNQKRIVQGIEVIFENPGGEKKGITIHEIRPIPTNDLTHLLASLENSEEGLTDRIRAEIFREIIANKNKS